MKRLGSITVVCGSMYAGKSEELIRLARRALYAKKKVQVFKHSIDSRFHEEMVVTHMGAQHRAVPVRSAEALREAINEDTDVVCVEEAQFFEDAIVPLVVSLADSGIEVVLAGLDQDFRREPFGPMPRLLAVADEVVKLRAICLKCGRPASHTYRTIEGRPAHKGDPVIVIGATEKYEARCRNCYELGGAPKKRFAKKKPTA